MVKQVYPEYDWAVWKFKFLPKTASEVDLETLRLCFDSIKSSLNIENPNDWYRVSTAKLVYLRVNHYIKRFGGLLACLRTLYPDVAWDESKFENRAIRKQNGK